MAELTAYVCAAPGDRELADVLAADLARASVRLLTGDAWDRQLDSIRTCDLFVFATSPEALRSATCTVQLEYAQALGRPLLPVLLRTVPLEFAPPALAHTQFVDYRAHTVEGAIALAVALAHREPAPPPEEPLPEPPSFPQQVSRPMESDDSYDEQAQYPRATLLFVLGAVGLFCAPFPVISVPVYILARRALRRIDRSGRRYANRDSVLYAKRLGLAGIIYSLVMVVGFGLVLLVFWLIYA